MLKSKREHDRGAPPQRTPRSLPLAPLVEKVNVESNLKMVEFFKKN